MEQVADQFAGILTGVFGVEESRVHPDATLESLELDSLDLVELTLVLEDETGVRIDEEEFAEIITIQDALNVIDVKRQGAPG